MLEAVYEELSVLSETKTKRITLVKHRISGVCFVKKVFLTTTEGNLYRQLQQHPHPHIANVIEVSQQEQSLCVIEEYINGVSLEYRMSEGKLSSEEVNRMMVQLLDALQHLHQLTPVLIHRDIKPANIMLAAGQIKLIDFDIARQFTNEKTRDTQIIGSVGYAAPEQYGFRESDQRSDLYALGVLLQELSENAGMQCYRRVIECCLQMDPDRRYQTAAEMKEAFLTCSLGYPIQQEHQLALPGFRHEPMLQRMLIYAYYVFCVYISMAVTFQNTTSSPSMEPIERICVFWIFLSLLWIPTNTFHMLQATPLYRSKQKLIRILNGGLIWMFSVFVVLLAGVLLSSILDKILR